MGLELARQFASRGANLALVARDAEELERAREDLSAYHVEVLTVACDVTDQQQEVEDMIARVRECFGDIDVLVNNAGTIQVGPMEEMTLPDYDEAMRTALLRAPVYHSGRAARNAEAAQRAHRQYRVHRRQNRHSASAAVQR